MYLSKYNVNSSVIYLIFPKMKIWTTGQVFTTLLQVGLKYHCVIDWVGTKDIENNRGKNQSVIWKKIWPHPGDKCKPNA